VICHFFRIYDDFNDSLSLFAVFFEYTTIDVALIR